MRYIVPSLAILPVCAGLLIAFTRGPEGSAIAKESQEHVQSAMGRSGLTLAGVSLIPPERVSLPLPAALKHRLKQVSAAVGIAMAEQQYAEEYWGRSLDGRTSIHCLVRLNGDHVIGISVVSKAGGTALFCESLAKEFPDYHVTLATVR